MFADGGEWLAGVLVVCWAVLVGHAEAVRRGWVTGAATRPGMQVVLGVAVLLFGMQAMLGDRIDDAGRGATRLDSVVLADVVAHRAPVPTAVAEFLNVAGGLLALGVVAVLAAAVLALRGRRVDALLMAGAPAASGLLDLGFKTGYARPRPPAAAHLVDATGFSLPSGHTLDATIILGTLAFLVVVALRGREVRMAVVALAAAGVVVAGAARVYLGVHWATDVMTGWLLGASWLAVCVALRMLLGDGGTTRTVATGAALHASHRLPHDTSGLPRYKTSLRMLLFRIRGRTAAS
jgi:undecaprenyl-diphosphatase